MVGDGRAVLGCVRGAGAEEPGETGYSLLIALHQLTCGTCPPSPSGLCPPAAWSAPGGVLGCGASPRARTPAAAGGAWLRP